MSPAIDIGNRHWQSTPANGGEPKMTDEKPAAVAVIGAGIMGTAIARRLLATGHAVHVFDIDRARVAALAAEGAAGQDSAAAATAAATYIILSLNHADIVERAVFGAQGVASAASPERLL
uniref:NAD(P)-binding domain-containing protein n=1 Tax=Methylobacterium sp. B34 TaxID=95563 RepID=UPI001FCC2BF1